LNLLPNKLPARDDLSSNSLKRSKVNATQAEYLRQIYPKKGTFYKLGEVNDGSFEGYYLLDCGQAQLFLKVLAKRHLAQQLEADRFARFVKAKGVGANPIVDGFPRMVGSMAVLAYRWVEGRFLSVSKSDMSQFGFNLGKLHKVLASFRECSDIRERTKRRYAHLNQVLNKLLSGECGVGPNPNQSLNLFKEYPDAFRSFKENQCQVIHGDLNVGNIMIGKDGVTFLDFEDSFHSWLPKQIDVAFALERIVLINTEDDKLAYDSSVCLLDNYVQAYPGPVFTHRGAFLDALKWLSIRSLCLLHHYEIEGRAWPNSEWEKFIRLIEHMNRREKLIYRIEKAYV
jgi:Phosphotransferase enzyme family